jgi:signal transduction histidine kinase
MESISGFERIERGLLRGIAAFRWFAWIWMAVVAILARGNLVRPVAAFLLIGTAFVVTVWLTGLLQAAPERLTGPVAVGIETGVAMSLQLADGAVYRAPHVFTPQPSLGVGWPLASVLMAGMAFGPTIGTSTGAAIGLARAISATLAAVPGEDAWLGPLSPAETLSLVTSVVQYALAGGIAGYGTRLVRDAEKRASLAERELADIRARESLARRLHDGVLQTLALVERRTDDPRLADLAREQERELRTMLFDVPSAGVVGAGALGDALRAAADRAERRYGLRVEVLVPDDVPHLDADVVAGVAGAVGEALSNAGKHAEPTRVVVYLEPDDDGGIDLSVRDDGRGFDPDTVAEGAGLRRSIRGRIAELGGEVELVTSPGHGTEVRLHIPAGPPP